MATDPKERPVAESEASERDSDAPKPITREDWLAYVALATTMAWVEAHVAEKVSEPYREEVAQDAREELVKAHPPRFEHQRKATLRTVVDWIIADHHGKRSRRKKYEGAMPTAPVRVDEAGEPAPAADDEGLVDIDPSIDPEQIDFRAEGWLLRRFLRDAVAGDARDEETLSWMIAWADEDKSYKDIAHEGGLPVNVVNKRVFEFKKKYAPRFQRYRNSVFILLFLGLLALAAIAYALLPRRASEPVIRPDRDHELTPTARPRAPEPPPTGTRFNQAQPTDEQRPPPLQPVVPPPNDGKRGRPSDKPPADPEAK